MNRAAVTPWRSQGLYVPPRESCAGPAGPPRREGYSDQEDLAPVPFEAVWIAANAIPLSAERRRARIKTRVRPPFPERWLSGRKHRFAKAPIAQIHTSAYLPWNRGG